jgi:NTE family protein
MVEAFNIIQDRIARARLAGDPPDLSLMLKLGHIGLSEFHRAGEAIEIGYQFTKTRIKELRRLRDVVVGE